MRRPHQQKVHRLLHAVNRKKWLLPHRLPGKVNWRKLRKLLCTRSAVRWHQCGPITWQTFRKSFTSSTHRIYARSLLQVSLTLRAGLFDCSQFLPLSSWQAFCCTLCWPTHVCNAPKSFSFSPKWIWRIVKCATKHCSFYNTRN